MKLQPVNRHILIAECEDPRTEGVIHRIKGQDPAVAFGVVEAIDESEPPIPLPFAVGDIVYFPAGTAKRVVVDGGIMKAIIHPSQVFGKCSDMKPMVLNSEVAVEEPKKKRPVLFAPGGNQIN